MPAMDLIHLWVGMRTGDSDSAGTDSSVVVIVNIDGTDLVHDTLPDTSQDDQEAGVANLYRVEVRERADLDLLNNSSIRIGIRGDDGWSPQLFFIWGMFFELTLTHAVIDVPRILALGMERGSIARLSTGKGRTSVPVRLVQNGRDTDQFDEVFIFLSTADVDEGGTDDTINLQFIGASGVLLDFDFPHDLSRGQANFFSTRPGIKLAKSDLVTIKLSTSGDDAWALQSIHIFGVRSIDRLVVPIVSHEFDSAPDFRLSTDPGEGVSEVRLDKSR
jgi:hypothetical protein